jgi:uncharacterized protein (DUF2235 family)
MPSPHKSLVLCFDGTWNNLKSNTNVARIYSEIADVSTGTSNQRKFYDEGVGTRWYDRLRGGAFGYGLDENIRLGYAWLASVYEADPADVTVGPTRDVSADPPRVVPLVPTASTQRKPNGDLPDTTTHSSGRAFLVGSDIYLLGFSRGAFTARSLGGMVNYLGVPVIDPVPDQKGAALADHPVVKKAWELYSARPTHDQRDAVAKGKASQSDVARITQHDKDVADFRRASRFPVRLHFLGVWDTVGALGIPKMFDYDWIPRFSSQYQFHDTSLCECVRNAFHALAIDEQRLPYKATLWTSAPLTAESCEQRWFPGAHADVGGGYEDDLLPAPPLEWLAKRAAACGLEFVNDRRIAQANGVISDSIAQAPARFDLDGTEYLSPVHDSYAEFMGGTYRVLRSVPGMGGRVFRRMLVQSDGINQQVDETAFAKWRADTEYRPPNLGQAGRTDVTFNVARDDDAGARFGDPVRAGG